MGVSNRQHIAALDEHRAIIRRQEREAYEMRDTLARIKALHAPKTVWLSPFTDDQGPRCLHCGDTSWPCATLRTLEPAP